MNLEQIYEAQQSEIGQASLKAKIELANKMRSKGLNVSLQVVECITDTKTGKKQYFLQER
jgi:hypothetical protein